ncbi:hypothetical protein CVT25_004516 [Psilocybe cyanescens]|uniref:Uncharacterized protein n=1 Tax=Psilocybe cyanescens TaxID=93625 RepID=A0A409XRV5_PSICY|nr:hypothetical protein CVT25_004516 [Psilocybe cyanescens]
MTTDVIRRVYSPSLVVYDLPVAPPYLLFFSFLVPSRDFFHAFVQFETIPHAATKSSSDIEPLRSASCDSPYPSSSSLPTLFWTTLSEVDIGTTESRRAGKEYVIRHSILISISSPRPHPRPLLPCDFHTHRHHQYISPLFLISLLKADVQHDDAIGIDRVLNFPNAKNLEGASVTTTGLLLQ